MPSTTTSVPASATQLSQRSLLHDSSSDSLCSGDQSRYYHHHSQPYASTSAHPSPVNKQLIISSGGSQQGAAAKPLPSSSIASASRPVLSKSRFRNSYSSISNSTGAFEGITPSTALLSSRIPSSASRHAASSSSNIGAPYDSHSSHTPLHRDSQPSQYGNPCFLRHMDISGTQAANSSIHPDPSSLRSSTPASNNMHNSSQQLFRSSRSRSGSGSIPGQGKHGGEAEVTANVMIWHTSAKVGSSALSKTPLLRDVPQVKYKLSKRSSSQANFDIGPAGNYDRSLSLKSAAPSWLREKPSRTRLSSPIANSSGQGHWRRATILFRENGVFTILNEDRSLLHSIQCSSLTATNIRAVDDSLFGISNVLGIFSRPSNFVPTSMSGAPSFSSIWSFGSQSMTSRISSDPCKPEPIFIELSSDAKLQYWKSLLRIYAQPQVYGPSSSEVIGGTHRCFRQIDLTIFEAKSIMPKMPVDPASHHMPQLHFQTTIRPSASGRSLQGGQSSAPERNDQTRASLDFEESMARARAALEEKKAKDAKAEMPQRTDSPPLGKGTYASAIPSQLTGDSPREESGRQSRAASLNESVSQTGDDMSSVEEHMSGPVSGLSGGARFATETTSWPQGTGAYGTPSNAQPARRSDKDLYSSTPFDRYCRIILNGDIVARTHPRLTGGDAFNVEKFKLIDLSDLQSLTVEVMHATQKAGTSSSGGQANISQKFVLLGVVEVPIDSLRRGEEIEGRFPIWSISSISPAQGTNNTFHKGLVGELKMTIKLREETVLPLMTYTEVERRLHAVDAPELVLGLTKHLSEDSVIAHLIEIWAASGTITERIATIADHESSSWGGRLEPELLFRANTLLSRSVDHFQRLLAFAWLEDCVGPTVKAICDEIRPALIGHELPGAADVASDYPGLTRSPVLGSTGTGFSSYDMLMTVEKLRKLCESLWENIYAHRHECPADLRTVLSDIRLKVNARYSKAKSTKPGIQGVGAFIFLRLFCAALNAPQLYGLTPSQPTRASQRKLLMLSKVLLALASKKPSFDRDKDRELLPLNDFLKTYAPAFDDYITVVSTKPPKAIRPKLLGTSCDDDSELQRAAKRKLDLLPVLHRESIPVAPYMLDKPVALASFVSFVVRAAEEREDDDARSEDESFGQERESSGGSGSGMSTLKRKCSDITRRVDDLVDLCCDIEEHAGTLIEQAGFDPQHLQLSKTRMTFLRSGDGRQLRSVVTAGKAASPSPSQQMQYSDLADTSLSPFASSTSSFTTVVGRGGDREQSRSPSPSPNAQRNRSRRATVTAVAFRSPSRDQGFRFSKGDVGSSPSSRRNSGMLSPSSQRPDLVSIGGGESDDELKRAYRDMRIQEAETTSHKKAADYVAAMQSQDVMLEAVNSPRRIGSRASFATPKRQSYDAAAFGELPGSSKPSPSEKKKKWWNPRS